MIDRIVDFCFPIAMVALFLIAIGEVILVVTAIALAMAAIFL